MPTCGATREPLRDAGWECDGTNLVTLADAKGPIRAGGVPVVLHADLVDELDDPVYSGFTTAPFLGGDHTHLTIERDG